MNVRNQIARRFFLSSLFVMTTLSTGFDTIAVAQMHGTAPTDAGPAPHWRFVRHDPTTLKQLGGGDMTAGMNKLGDVGYELFITTANDLGATGWLYFRQSPWIAPMQRPKFEYKVLDDQAITDLGHNSFGDGLTKLENEGWQLLAITSDKGGGAGWHFFFREKAAMALGSSAAAPSVSGDQAVNNQPGNPRSESQAAEAADDFSTPRAAVQTLIAGATSRNVDLLSKCFADNASDEFTTLRTKTAAQKDLDDLATLFQGATVTNERIKGERKAIVSVKLGSRDEDIELTKTAAGWQVVDF